MVNWGIGELEIKKKEKRQKKKIIKMKSIYNP
jgi:hypothetical protein